MNALTLFSIFIITLESYGTDRYFLLLPILFVFILRISRVEFRKKDLLFIVYFVGIVILLTLLSKFEFFTFKDNINYSAFSFLFGILFKLFSCIAIYYSAIDNSNRIYKMLGIVLSVHLGMFWIQFLTVYSTGIYLDVLEPISGISQRYIGGFTLPLIGAIYRPTGFYSEPSTFFICTLFLVFCRYWISNQTSKLDYLLLGTGFFTFSAAANFIAFLYLFVLFLSSNTRFYKKLTLVLFMVFIAAIVFNQIGARLEATEGAILSLRKELVQITLSQDILSLIFGNGILGLPDNLANLLRYYSMRDLRLAAVNDGGLWLFIIMKLGVLGLLFLIFLASRRFTGIKERIIFSTALLTKISLFNFVFIFFVLFCCLYEKESVSEIS